MLRALLILVAIGLVVALYAVFVERNWFALRTHRIPCLPPGSAPLRVLHISDLHLRAGQRRKRAWLRALARLEPDLVVATGDLLGDAISVDATVETVGALRGKHGSFLVLGSNDYYAPAPSNPFKYFRKRRKKPRPSTHNPWPEMVAGLQQRGWRLVNNERFELAGIDGVGLDDAHINRADFTVPVPRTDERFRLAVMHSPDGFRRLVASDYDLIVAGHTHGGQVCMPLLGALVTNCELPRRMARGVHRVGASWLHVCGGLGTSMYAPYRFACRPEACVLELEPSA